MERKLESDQKIAVFLHVATMGRYQEVANEMLCALRKVGLSEISHRIEVNIVGDGDFLLPYGADNIFSIRRGPDVKLFEFPTLNSMQEYASLHSDSLILYLNCLGGRYVGAGWDIRWQWRRLLELMLIERFQHCVMLLNDHDICGIEWSVRPMPHMTSNNWWARAAYIANLPSPEKFLVAVLSVDFAGYGERWRNPEVVRRHAAEFWIGADPRPRPVNLMPLTQFGLPRGEFGTISWWEMPGIDWASAARRRLGNKRWDRDHLRFLGKKYWFWIKSVIGHPKRLAKRLVPRRFLPKAPGV